MTGTSPLSAAEVRVLDAATRRIFPGDQADPGAAEAGVLDYLAGLLAGAGPELPGLYRAGLAGLDRRAREAGGAGFADLAAGEQDAILAGLDAELDAMLARVAAGVAAADARSEAFFFGLLCEHTLQGVLGDPAYGGNRGAVGWRLIGFPGARWGYSAAEMARGVDASALPISTLADLGRLAGSRPVWRQAAGGRKV